MVFGITVKHSTDGSRIEIRSRNQAGVLYSVPAEASWVATQEQLPAHSLAGFLNELTGLADPQVDALMRKWGLYFRPLSLEEGEDD